MSLRPRVFLNDTANKSPHSFVVHFGRPKLTRNTGTTEIDCRSFAIYVELLFEKDSRNYPFPRPRVGLIEFSEKVVTNRSLVPRRISPCARQNVRVRRRGSP